MAYAMAGDETTFRIVLEEDDEPGAPSHRESVPGGLPTNRGDGPASSGDIDSLRQDFGRNVRNLTDQFVRGQFGFLPHHEFRRMGQPLTLPQMLQPDNRRETLNQLFAGRYATSPMGSQYAQMGQLFGVGKSATSQSGIAGVESLLSGRATGMGGSAGGMMAVAAIAQFIGDKIEKVVKLSGRVSAEIADTKPSNVLDKTANAAASITEHFGQLGRATGAVITSMNQMRNSFSQRAQEISGYSGPLAVSTAQAEIRRLMFDIREAQGMGGKYAKFVDAQSRLETSFAQAIQPLKEKGLMLLTAVFERLEKHSALFEDLLNLVGTPALDVLEKVASMGLLVVDILAAILGTDVERMNEERINKNRRDAIEAIGIWTALTAVPIREPMPGAAVAGPAGGAPMMPVVPDIDTGVGSGAGNAAAAAGPGSATGGGIGFAGRMELYARMASLNQTMDRVRSNAQK